jgi:hypothetical protein
MCNLPFYDLKKKKSIKKCMGFVAETNTIPTNPGYETEKETSSFAIKSMQFSSYKQINYIEIGGVNPGFTNVFFSRSKSDDLLCWHSSK